MSKRKKQKAKPISYKTVVANKKLEEFEKEERFEDARENNGRTS